MKSVCALLKKYFSVPVCKITERDNHSSNNGGRPEDRKNCDPIIDNIEIRLTESGKFVVLDKHRNRIEPGEIKLPFPASEIMQLQTLSVLMVRQNPCYAYVQSADGWRRIQVNCPPK